MIGREGRCHLHDKVSLPTLNPNTIVTTTHHEPEMRNRNNSTIVFPFLPTYPTPLRPHCASSVRLHRRSLCATARDEVGWVPWKGADGVVSEGSTIHSIEVRGNLLDRITMGLSTLSSPFHLNHLDLKPPIIIDPASWWRKTGLWSRNRDLDGERTRRMCKYDHPLKLLVPQRHYRALPNHVGSRHFQHIRSSSMGVWLSSETASKNNQSKMESSTTESSRAKPSKQRSYHQSIPQVTRLRRFPPLSRIWSQTAT